MGGKHVNPVRVLSDAGVVPVVARRNLSDRKRGNGVRLARDADARVRLQWTFVFLPRQLERSHASLADRAAHESRVPDGETRREAELLNTRRP